MNEMEGSTAYKVEDNEKVEVKKRDEWHGKLDFFMSALSFAVGMGNMWRFPYLCYRNGGGAFLIPYVILMLIIGFPLMFLEFCFGQFGRHGIVSIWKACPLFEGIGWGMFLVSSITCVYYSMLNGWCVFYIGASLSKELPWQTCDNPWNTPDCVEPNMIAAERNCSLHNGTWFKRECVSVNVSQSTATKSSHYLINATGEASKIVSPTDEFFHERMLGISDDLSGLSQVQWHLALCLLLVYVVVFVCLFKGIKTSGKATYVTALFPYVVLVILMIRGVTLDGAMDGLKYYLKPEWKRLASFGVWQDAAIQVFFSLSSCWGGLITLASYNKFHNNAFRDAIAVSTGDCLTSIFGGIVVFTFIGYMAHEMNVDVDKVATQGAGLAFVVYPQAVTTLPISQLWSVLFFFMLLNVGIGTQFTLITTTHTTLVDAFPTLLKSGRRPTILLLAICVTIYLLGLFISTRSGIYVLQLMDTYSASYGLLVVAICMTFVLIWVYGHRRLFRDIKMMLGKPPSKIWVIIWGIVAPFLLGMILISTLINMKRTSYRGFTLPIWSDVAGWMIVAVQVGVIPGVALYKLFTVRQDLNIRERIQFLTSPAEDWGPPPEAKKIMPTMEKGSHDDMTGNRLLVDGKEETVAV